MAFWNKNKVKNNGKAEKGKENETNKKSSETDKGKNDEKNKNKDGEKAEGENKESNEKDQDKEKPQEKDKSEDKKSDKDKAEDSADKDKGEEKSEDKTDKDNCDDKADKDKEKPNGKEGKEKSKGCCKGCCKCCSKVKCCRAGLCKCWYCGVCCLLPIFWLCTVVIIAFSLYLAVTFLMRQDEDGNDHADYAEEYALLFGVAVCAILCCVVVQITYIHVHFEKISKCSRIGYIILFLITLLMCLGFLIWNMLRFPTNFVGVTGNDDYTTDANNQSPIEFAYDKSLTVVLIAILMMTLHIYLYNILKFVEERDLKNGVLCGGSKSKEKKGDCEAGTGGKKDANARNNNNNSANTSTPVRPSPSMAPRQFWSTKTSNKNSSAGKHDNIKVFYFNA